MPVRRRRRLLEGRDREHLMSHPCPVPARAASTGTGRPALSRPIWGTRLVHGQSRVGSAEREGALGDNPADDECGRQPGVGALTHAMDPLPDEVLVLGQPAAARRTLVGPRPTDDGVRDVHAA